MVAFPVILNPDDKPSGSLASLEIQTVTTFFDPELFKTAESLSKVMSLMMAYPIQFNPDPERFPVKPGQNVVGEQAVSTDAQFKVSVPAAGNLLGVQVSSFVKTIEQVSETQHHYCVMTTNGLLIFADKSSCDDRVAPNTRALFVGY